MNEKKITFCFVVMRAMVKILEKETESNSWTLTKRILTIDENWERMDFQSRASEYTRDEKVKKYVCKKTRIKLCFGLSQKKS